MGHALAIAAGGAIGALLRYWVGGGVQALFGRDFPLGTLSVNVLGSFAIGILSVVLMERVTIGEELRALIMVGVLGAFTTFSTFSIETLALLQVGRVAAAASSVALNVTLSIAGAWVGVVVANRL